MQGITKRIQELNKKIANCNELLADDMARNILGDDGIEAIEYMVNLYKQKIKELHQETGIAECNNNRSIMTLENVKKIIRMVHQYGRCRVDECIGLVDPVECDSVVKHEELVKELLKYVK